MNLRILEIPYDKRAAACSKQDCTTTAIAAVQDVDTTQMLVVYCRKHVRELQRELERLGTRHA